MKLRPLLPIAFVGLLLVSGCQKRPKGVLSDSDMANLLADLHIAQVYTDHYSSQFSTDSSRKAFRQAVLIKHGVTTEQLDSSLAWYGRHIDRYTELYDKVEANLKKRKDAAQNRSDGFSGVVSDANAYPMPRMVLLSPLSSSDYFTFSFPADDLQKGEGLKLKYRSVPKESGVSDFMLAVEYDDNSVSYTTSSQRTQQGAITTSLLPDSLKTPVKIFGYIRMKNNNGRKVWIDSLQLLRVSSSEIDGAGARLHLPPMKNRNKNKSKKMEVNKDSVASFAKSPEVSRTPAHSPSPQMSVSAPISGNGLPASASAAPVNIPQRSKN